MRIRILGAHAIEANSARAAAILVDEVLALDAGSLCASLSLADQQKLKAILLTHHHYDHVRDIPFIGMNLAHMGSVSIYSTAATLDTLCSHLLDDEMYPDFRRWPEGQPAIRLVTIEANKPFHIAGYGILAVPVRHSVPSVGFQITSSQGKSLFYTSDTGAGLSECWGQVSPDLLITELTLPQKMEEWARRTGHLTPQLLKAELLEFRRLKGYLPPTVLIHLNPLLENDIAAEVAEVSRDLGASITLGREGAEVLL
ncbi:MAG: lactamase [Chloroflexi bacterium]|nr:lactamase [Chloroflexota bacterium]